MTTPTIEIRRYSLDNCAYVEEMVPHMYVVIQEYTPHSCPWDYYGMKQVKEWSAVMKAAGVDYVTLETKRRIIHPIGTGSGGAVRFGDNMMASTYKLAVYKHQEEKAFSAWTEHRENVRKWLWEGGPMPEACR